MQGKKALIEGRINAEMTTSDGVAMILADRQKDQPDWVPGDLVITTPTPGYRIGSESVSRLHPILGIVRLHAGGDIGAPSGTPIYAPLRLMVRSWPRCAAGTATPPCSTTGTRSARSTGTRAASP